MRNHLPLPQTFPNGMHVRYFYHLGVECVSREIDGVKEFAIFEKGSTDWCDEKTFYQLF